MLSSCSRTCLRSTSAWRSSVRLSANVNFRGMPRAAIVKHASPHFPGPANIRTFLSDDGPPPELPKLLRQYSENTQLPPATHEIKDLGNVKPGETVVLLGYLGGSDHLSKHLCFTPLVSKDLRHSVQLVSGGKDSGDVHYRFRLEQSKNAVAVKGVVKVRKQPKPGVAKNPKAQKPKVPKTAPKPNPHHQTIGNVDIVLKDYTLLNSFPRDTQFDPTTVFYPHQRHLQLRASSELREALVFRAKASAICRNELTKQDFIEVETPLLFKSTPEGAREFLVPTRTKGLAYALPQSPQQYKQTLMASGFAKYFQIAKCFRDEDLRADRQPEFTQLDLEMSFASADDVMDCIERLIGRLWTQLGVATLAVKFPRMTYNDAMAKYGSDKPDVRLGMEISRVDHLLPADLISKIGPIAFPAVDVFKLRLDTSPSKASRFVSDFMKSPEGLAFIDNPDGQPGVAVFDSSKPMQGLQVFGFEAAQRLEEDLGLEEGDVVIIQARKNEPFTGGSTAVGRLRLALHKAAVEKELLPKPEGFEFLWITDFPLFSPINDTDPGQGGAAGLAATHHPFTAPKTVEDIHLLIKDPKSARADHYDLVVNGVELGGGSRRIHVAEVQEWVMREVLKMSDERIEDFRHLLEVLRAGCPPHAGIALGFDRLIAVMLGKDSVRDVIAFPKSGKGEDMLVKSPNKVTKEQLETYHLQLKD
ncbi:tRNA synthetases class II-domain-containing protein [Phyllosticta citribraziliensis]|uniref:tRNA synthetases class II-domain-containing protein n=1 Tax=Phyllosticta citribraziliensis TaxID=989973 RepID=A0ABR1M8W9_9PEZI